MPHRIKGTLMRESPNEGQTVIEIVEPGVKDVVVAAVPSEQLKILQAFYGSTPTGRPACG
jgi:hypothetical protein